MTLTYGLERISDFLSKFKRGNEKNLEDNFADIGIDDVDQDADSETRSHKYMKQLVRVVIEFDASKTRLTSATATDSQQRATNDRDRLGGCPEGKALSITLV